MLVHYCTASTFSVRLPLLPRAVAASSTCVGLQAWPSAQPQARSVHASTPTHSAGCEGGAVATRSRRRLPHTSGGTLVPVAAAGAVSLGYLSEVERGVKEASSELLAAICDALDLPMSVVLDDVSRRVARVESLSAPVALPVGDRAAVVSASAA